MRARAQSWAEILCCGLHNWHVYWCVLTGNAVQRDALATVQGELKGKVICTKSKVTDLACMHSGPPSWKTGYVIADSSDVFEAKWRKVRRPAVARNQT